MLHFKKILSTILIIALIFTIMPYGRLFTFKTKAAESGTSYLLYQANAEKVDFSPFPHFLIVFSDFISFCICRLILL
ncbi:MAG: hypothetical protein IKD04_06050 [Clostridia bacterium]|nr:hypothetical protein [Clostridia bacterium]